MCQLDAHMTEIECHSKNNILMRFRTLAGPTASVVVYIMELRCRVHSTELKIQFITAALAFVKIAQPTHIQHKLIAFNILRFAATKQIFLVSSW